MEDKIILKVQGNVARITLNNPLKLNCIGFEMLRALDHTLNEISENELVRVLLIQGAGDRSFSTGADLNEYNSLSTKQADEWILTGNRIFNTIAILPIPTVAFIQGYAIGGGLELALACDFRIGTEKAILSSPELQHGWLPGWGGMTRLRNLVGEARAKEVVMLNEKISAHEALRLGLLTRILKEDVEADELREFLDHLGSLNPVAVRLAKSALMDAGRTSEGADLQLEIHAMKIAKDNQAS